MSHRIDDHSVEDGRMASRGKESAKTLGIIVSAIVIIVLLWALVALFHGAHSGG